MNTGKPSGLNMTRAGGSYVMKRVLTFLLCCLSTIAFAASSVTLAWDASPDASVVGYRVYYGPALGSYTNSAAVGNVTNATLSGLTTGFKYYFAATAYNSTGEESPFSNEISYTPPVAPVQPAPVTGFRALVASIGRWLGLIV